MVLHYSQTRGRTDEGISRYCRHVAPEVSMRYQPIVLKFNEFGSFRLSVSIASVVPCLPGPEEDECEFKEAKCMAPTQYNAVEELAAQQRDRERQRADAAQRQIVWDADGLTDLDADGEDDPDCVRLQKNKSLIGVRQDNLTIRPLSAKLIGKQIITQSRSVMSSSSPADHPEHFEGAPESIPSGIHSYVSICFF